MTNIDDGRDNPNVRESSDDETSSLVLLSVGYAALNDWRISKLQRQDQWGAILFPTSVAIFTSTLTFGGEKYGLMILGLLASGLVLFLWRWNDHTIDKLIREHAYPRLVELEAALGYRAIREWLKKSWWPTQTHDWLPSRVDIEAKDKELRSLSLFKRLQSVGAGRPLFRWDSIVLYLWILELLVVVVIIIAKIQGWTWVDHFV